MRLVDAEKQHEIIKNNDPQDLVWHAIEKGVELTKEDVAKSVDAAFASGLLQLSEIVFDKKHHFAMIMFDFECGSLCGDGAVLVFEKTDGKWKQATGGKCAEWVS